MAPRKRSPGRPARTDDAGRMTVYLPAKLREWIRLECARRDVSYSDLVAEAVEMLKSARKR